MLKNAINLVTVLFILALMINNAIATEIYASPDTSLPQGNGSNSSPFNSVLSALNIAQPGDIIRLLPGVYIGPVNFPRGGTINNPITLMSDGAARSAVIDCQDKAVNCVEINYGNVIIDGLEVKNVGYNGIKVDGDLRGSFDPNQSYGRYAGNSTRYNYANGADNITIKNNYVHHIGYDGIKISHTNNVSLINNEVYKTGTVHFTTPNMWQQGIDMVGVYNSIIKGNYIHDDVSNPIMAVGLFVKGGSENILIENNVVENIASPYAAIEVGGDTEWYNTRYNPINVPGLNDRVLSQDYNNNEVDRKGTYSSSTAYTNQYMSEARNCIVRGNIVKNADPAFSARNAYNTKIYNNTVTDSGWSQGWVKLWNDGNAIHRCENTYLYNNLFYNKNVKVLDLGRYRDKSIGTGFDNIQGLRADFNIFWNMGVATISGFGSAAPVGMDSNSKTIDPMIDSSNKPNAGSPIIDSGADLVALGVINGSENFIDRFGTTRPRNIKYDIGAIEYFAPNISPVKNLIIVK